MFGWLRTAIEESALRGFDTLGRCVANFEQGRKLL